MSQYYKPGVTKYNYRPDSTQPYRLSRSKIDLFLNCPRCFYLDRRLGVGQPPGYPFALNSAVDTLLKKEFDIHRSRGSQPPLLKSYGLDAIPLKHEKIDEWRDAIRRGITYHHKHTNFVITGGVDDVWVNPQGELIIVDYKATSKNGDVSLDADWQIGYKRQMEIYQWLFKMNDYKVSAVGYFVYCNGNTDAEAFDAKLEFDIKLIPYEGKTDWVENSIIDAYNCLQQSILPQPSPECDYCTYRNAAKIYE